MSTATNHVLVLFSLIFLSFVAVLFIYCFIQINDESKRINLLRSHPVPFNKGHDSKISHHITVGSKPKFTKKTLSLPIHKFSSDEFKKNATDYLSKLHKKLGALSGPEVQAIDVWSTFIDVSKSTILKWDIANKHKYPRQRYDNSLFVSVVSFRDPFCPMTIQSLYEMAKYPDTLYVGLVQQNCFEEHCTGIDNKEHHLKDSQDKDIDCYEEFCKSSEGVKSNACKTGAFQVLNVNETEGLGPHMARYFAAKMYRGEHYYLQIDSHSEFVTHWDEILIKMFKKAPAHKPVISGYPPGPHESWMNSVGMRTCDSQFTEEDGGAIRLSSATTYEKFVQSRPRYSPFVAAGFLFTDASMLVEVPFDPLMPWLFMGEEIALAAKLWTHGYDFFSPTTNVLNHYYVRPNKPKFWESVDRFFGRYIFDELNGLTLMRVKRLLNYPEARDGHLDTEKYPRILFTRLGNYSLGSDRRYEDYLALAGIDMERKVTHANDWCYEGLWPKEAKSYKFKHD